MATSITIDIIDPQINLVKEPGPEGITCQLLYINTASEPTTVVLHFSDIASLRAFVGLQTLAIGGIHGESNTPGT